MSGKMTHFTFAALLILAAMPVSASADSPNWNQQVGSVVRANFSYPRSAEIRREQGRAILRVALSADGTISGVQLSQSSGSAILDREALRIVERIGRFPIPPKGTSVVTLPITWQLTD
ncbi:MAG: energy transducer TonB [Sphingobium sp.]